MKTIFNYKKKIDGEWIDIDYDDIDWSTINDIIVQGKHHFVRDEWVLCKERLPEKEGNYLVSGGGKIWICEF